MATPSLRTIKLVIAAGMFATALHFADNALAIERYPEPGWITPLGVVAAWCAVTAIAVVALARKTIDRVFFTAAGAYVLVLISGLLHYAFGTPMHMAARSNVTVLAEALIGLALAGVLVWNRVKSST